MLIALVGNVALIVLVALIALLSTKFVLWFKLGAAWTSVATTLAHNSSLNQETMWVPRSKSANSHARTNTEFLTTHPLWGSPRTLCRSYPSDVQCIRMHEQVWTWGASPCDCTETWSTITYIPAWRWGGGEWGGCFLSERGGGCSTQKKSAIFPAPILLKKKPQAQTNSIQNCSYNIVHSPFSQHKYPDA